MAITINGTCGIDFDITESDTALTTGSIVQVHVVESDISDIVLANTDLVASLSGFTGTTLVSFDLTDLLSKDSPTDIGNGTNIALIRNNKIPFGKIKSLVIHNKTLVTNILKIEQAATSFIRFGATGDNVDIQPNSAVSFIYPSGLDCTTNKLLNIIGSAATTDLEIYILGTP